MNDDFKDFEEPYMIRPTQINALKSKRFRRPNWTLYFTLGLGILFLFFAMKEIADIRKVNSIIKQGHEVTATVTNVKKSYRTRRSTSPTKYYTYVDYEIDGQSYKNVQLDTRLNNRAVGLKLPVYYELGKPNRVVAKNSTDYDKYNMIFYFIFAGIFIVLAVISLTQPELVQKILEPKGYGNRYRRW